MVGRSVGRWYNFVSLDLLAQFVAFKEMPEGLGKPCRMSQCAVKLRKALLCVAEVMVVVVVSQL